MFLKNDHFSVKCPWSFNQSLVKCPWTSIREFTVPIYIFVKFNESLEDLKLIIEIHKKLHDADKVEKYGKMNNGSKRK